VACIIEHIRAVSSIFEHRESLRQDLVQEVNGLSAVGRELLDALAYEQCAERGQKGLHAERGNQYAIEQPDRERRVERECPIPLSPPAPVGSLTLDVNASGPVQ